VVQAFGDPLGLPLLFDSVRIVDELAHGDSLQIGLVCSEYAQGRF
jgi:hypothetical protein